MGWMGEQARFEGPKRPTVHRPHAERRTPAAGSPCPAACPRSRSAGTPLVRVENTTRQDRTSRLQPLPDDYQTQLVQAGERGEVRASEGSVRHVEVFRLGSLRTPIIGRPRPLPGRRRADRRYTLDCEEPHWSRWHRACDGASGHGPFPLSMRWRFTGNAAAKAAASAIIMPIQRVGLTRPGFGRFVSLWVRIGRTWRRWIRC
jgi:hypothetical protein